MKKIYTRTGDEGTTSLFGGGRVPKDHQRIEAYGTVDEANSFLGLARTQLRGAPGAERLDAILHRLQQELFILGADLATPQEARSRVPRISQEHIEQVERDIDALQGDLPELKHFILPGGSPGGSTLHVARTVCRRAERMIVRAEVPEALNERAVPYLNRLSDLLFVLARWANHRAGVTESTWQPETS